MASKRRIRTLLGTEPGVVDWGRYGLGRERSLADYEAYAGISFATRTISDAARRAECPMG